MSPAATLLMTTEPPKMAQLPKAAVASPELWMVTGVVVGQLFWAATQAIG
jgi:hypothetical protein